MSTPAPRSALNQFLASAGLTFVDVGGRGGALPALKPLAPLARYCASEPDCEEAERVVDELVAEHWREVTIIREAIASRRGEATLYLTKQRGMSSLLEPDPAVTRHFYLRRKFVVTGTTTVPTLPLDDAAAKYGFTDACFLKLDTQGTELDILKSGGQLVGRSIVGVHVECLFRPFYKGQSLFADVDAHLREEGFSLFTLARMNLRRDSLRMEECSARVAAWAHCLYLREPETLLAGGPAVSDRDLPRLLALAVAFYQFDLASEVMAAIRDTRLLSGRDADCVASDLSARVQRTTRAVTEKATAQGPQRRALFSSAARDRLGLE